MAKEYKCFRCKGTIKRTVESCTRCLKDFHPKCSNSTCHKVFDDKNRLVPCTGPYEIFKLKSEGNKEYKRRRVSYGAYHEDELEEALTQTQDNVRDSLEDNNIINLSINSQSIGITENAIVNQQIIQQLQHINESVKIPNQIPTIVNCQGLEAFKKTEETHVDIPQIIAYNVEECIKKEFTKINDIIKETITCEIIKLTNIHKQEINKIQDLYSQSSCNCNCVHNKNISNPTKINVNTKSINIKTNKSANMNNERIIINPVANTNGINTIEHFKKSIDIVDLGIGVDKILNRKDGKIILDLHKECDKNILTKEIENKLGDKYEVISRTKRYPKLKIVGLDEETMKLDENILISNLCKQNKLNSTDIQESNSDYEQVNINPGIDGLTEENDNIENSKTNHNNNDNHNKDVNYRYKSNDTIVKNEIKIIKRYATRNGFGSAIVEVPPYIHKKILNNNKIKIGWRSCKVYNYVDIIRCYNCWSYNHFKDKCTKKKVCRICADNHDEKDCTRNQKQCINCNKMNQRKSTNWETKHEATDLNCQYHKMVLEKVEQKTLYDKQ